MGYMESRNAPCPGLVEVARSTVNSLYYYQGKCGELTAKCSELESQAKEDEKTIVRLTRELSQAQGLLAQYLNEDEAGL